MLDWFFDDDDPPSKPKLKAGEDPTEEEKRDEGIDRVSGKYSDLVAAGFPIALKICAEKGRVTSTEVKEAMEADPRYATRMAWVEPGGKEPERRWLGQVFRRGQGWKRVGWESTGSHARPVAIWTRDE
jgi:hypothetical protein